ncbi:polypeptide N-acetylgalactosaminyltransferase 18-like [Molothrus aeneus]|uniref:polypeptide N-acetylgalactosaminyltransferase 18-like n=1 Tax=Molothrus aeneus TaxID=84833 RepID=UPI003458D3D5
MSRSFIDLLKMAAKSAGKSRTRESAALWPESGTAAPRASALPLAAGTGQGRGCRARQGRGAGASGGWGGLGKWPGGVKDVQECKRDTMAEKNGRAGGGPAGPLSAGGGGAVAALRGPGAGKRCRNGAAPPEPAHAPLQVLEATAGRKIPAWRRRCPPFVPPALQGVTNNNAHSLGIRMKVEPEGARHTQERAIHSEYAKPQSPTGRRAGEVGRRSEAPLRFQQRHITSSPLSPGVPHDDGVSLRVRLKRAAPGAGHSWEKKELKEKLQQYVDEVNAHKPGFIEVVWHSRQEGLIRSRVSGWRAATAPVVTLFDAHVEFNVGWAEPVLTRIKENRKRVISPSFDSIKYDNFEIEEYPLSAQGFDWELWCRYLNPPKSWWKLENTTAPIRSPALIGCFIVDREYFQEIGLLDEGMEVYGGENVELGIRNVHYTSSQQLHVGVLSPTIGDDDNRCLVDVNSRPRLIECNYAKAKRMKLYWQFTQGGPIQNRKSKRCLELQENNENEFGFQVVLHKCTGQRWSITNVLRSLSL